jgi:hypothetical protein
VSRRGLLEEHSVFRSCRQIIFDMPALRSFCRRDQRRKTRVVRLAAIEGEALAECIVHSSGIGRDGRWRPVVPSGARRIPRVRW